MPVLTGQQILARPDRRTREVPVPEWGPEAQVLIGEIGALARARIRDWWQTQGRVPEPAEDEIVTTDSSPGPDEDLPREYTDLEQTELMLRWLIETILDPETQRPTFTRDQLDALGAKSPAALNRIYAAVLDLNLQTQTAVEDAEKNSEPAAGTGSGGD